MAKPEIEDRPEENRYVAQVDGREAELGYEIEAGTMRLVHTEVPKDLEGRGIGSALARAALDSARERGVNVWPQCPFVASYIKRHPEYLEIVSPEYPERESLRRGGG